MGDDKIQRETKDLEFKSQVSNTFLKTVSAYANYGTGTILFGVADDGQHLGLENAQEELLIIENKINNAIDPLPDFLLTLESDATISLEVQEGPYKPYTYKGKAYRRTDSSTVEVGRLELQRLILEGSHLSFEELPAPQQNLSFNYLEQELKEALGVQGINLDIMKTLELYSDAKGYNNAALLLADSNESVGIDIARFGESNSIIKERQDLSGASLLQQLHQAVSIYEREYTHEEVRESTRQRVERIPREAFREALANALIHRLWDVQAATKVSMFPDRIEISSPGGLPAGVSREDYLNGSLSLLRNPILGTVFFRLGYIEKFGTGITRIQQTYRASLNQPEFLISDSSVKIILPFVANRPQIGSTARRVLEVLLQADRPLPRAQVEQEAGLTTISANRALKELVDARAVERVGKGPATKYRAL